MGSKARPVARCIPEDGAYANWGVELAARHLLARHVGNALALRTSGLVRRQRDRAGAAARSVADRGGGWRGWLLGPGGRRRPRL